MRNRVRELRTEQGLSQGELAAAVDVSRQTINSIEQERYTPSLPLALALARYFGSTVEVPRPRFAGHFGGQPDHAVAAACLLRCSRASVGVR